LLWLPQQHRLHYPDKSQHDFAVSRTCCLLHWLKPLKEVMHAPLCAVSLALLWQVPYAMFWHCLKLTFTGGLAPMVLLPPQYVCSHAVRVPKAGAQMYMQVAVLAGASLVGVLSYWVMMVLCERAMPGQSPEHG
jgi:hypothetical protein